MSVDGPAFGNHHQDVVAQDERGHIRVHRSSRRVEVLPERTQVEHRPVRPEKIAEHRLQVTRPWFVFVVERTQLRGPRDRALRQRASSSSTRAAVLLAQQHETRLRNRGLQNLRSRAREVAAADRKGIAVLQELRDELVGLLRLWRHLLRQRRTAHKTGRHENQNGRRATSMACWMKASRQAAIRTSSSASPRSP